MEKGSRVTFSVVPFGGWANNLLVTNQDVEVLLTLDVGPRIISYKLAGKQNVLKEYTEELGKHGEATWRIRGGHRCWLAPEDTTRTYHFDNAPCTWRQVGERSAEVTAPEEAPYKVRKTMRVELEERGSRVTVTIGVTNTGSQITRVALWGPTVLAAGGIEMLPLPARRPHPGPPANASGPSAYAPALSLVLWPYFDFSDDRWRFGSRFVTLRHRSDRGPTKIGLSAMPNAWAAYLNREALFVKRFSFDATASYADGTVFQTFSNEDMVEVETVGPLTNLAPGEKTELGETWELIADSTDPATIRTDEDVQALLTRAHVV